MAVIFQFSYLHTQICILSIKAYGLVPNLNLLLQLYFQGYIVILINSHKMINDRLNVWLWSQTNCSVNCINQNITQYQQGTVHQTNIENSHQHWRIGLAGSLSFNLFVYPYYKGGYPINNICWGFSKIIFFPLQKITLFAPLWSKLT